VVVYDLCASDTVVLAAAATNAPAALIAAMQLWQRAGQRCRLSRPAGVAHGGDAGNEALDALQKGVPAADIDTRCALASTIRTGRWRAPAWLAPVLHCWRTCNTIMARSAIALFSVAPEGADGEAP
jgi:hypothetical protein